jgi:hypothetical protein
MAILITNDGDKTVNTIADRNLITKRFDGMQVTVLDAIADTLVGGGEACYQWNEMYSRWMLIWKTAKDNLNFITETKIITNGKVTADFLPSNGTIWDCYVTDVNNVLIADVTAPVINGNEIDLAVQDYNGLTMTYTYGYGLIEAAVYAASDRSYFIVDSNYTAIPNDRMLVDTSAGSVSIQLPASPYVGAVVKLVDVASSFGTNPITIYGNGSKIAGTTNDILVDVAQQSLMLVYSGSTYGWVYGI